MSMDVPAQSFALANNKDGKSLVLVSDCKYGYRGDEKGLVIDLIRSTFGPDPFPEVADHQFMVSLAIVDDELDAKKQSQSLCEPFVSVSATSHEGTLPTEGAFVEVLSGNIVIDAYKVSENDKNKMVLRLYSIDLDKSKVQIKMQKPIKQAYFVNILEELIEGKVAADKDIISFDLEINKTYSIMIEFA
ncbi:MAG: hypothetical protein KAQ68_06295 [Clostridiales bacterium]|nr:hypothetical protein [Clostridiales bacterium]